MANPQLTLDALAGEAAEPTSGVTIANVFTSELHLRMTSPLTTVTLMNLRRRCAQSGEHSR
jgi:hypothetical protein